MFHVIQDAHCVVRNKRGVHKQVKVYHYNSGLYIGLFGGYVRLLAGGNIGTPDCSYRELVLPAGVVAKKGDLGRLELEK